MNKMIKMFALALALVFSMSGLSFAATAVLSDADLDGVSAGDWVVLTDSSGNETVQDVYTTNNTLWLLESSQKDIQAVSNANAVDSAVAVQSNVTSVSDNNTPTANVAIKQSNTSDVTNYRPSDSKAYTSSDVHTVKVSESSTSGASKSSSESFSLTNVESASKSSASSSSAALAYNETLDIIAAEAGSSKEISKSGVGGSTYAAALLVDYDKVILAAAASAESCTFTSTKTTVIAGSSSCSSSSYATSSKSSEESTTHTESCNSRNSKGVNNHILLDATSQMNIQAVSNLNAVGSGVSIQNNIASNVGVNGSITHSNNATVSSGF